MKIPVALLAILATAASAATDPQPPDLAAVTRQLLPLPQSVNLKTGSLTLTAKTSIRLGAGCELVGRHFADRLRRGTGWSVPESNNCAIRLEVVPNPKGSPEAYTLAISPAGVTLRAASAAGIARGAETLLQLMPPAVYGSNRCETLLLPALTITDAPQFAWRGLMLDVSRRFQDKDTIIKLLDGMALSKLNLFHWHLTDDQGWRLPIEGYPKLTANGPAYTRAEVRAVVEHAAKLGITILPEVDMPGHSGASCRAYPEISILNAQQKPTGTMNPGAPATYRFIEAVLKDVTAQFPNSKQVHIGADEVGSGGWIKDPQCVDLMKREQLKSAHELYVYFVNRAVAIAKRHGRQTIAWDEAFDARNDPALIIMSWRSTSPGIKAAKAGRKVIFSPNPQIYLNHANSRSKQNPVAYSAHTSYLNECYFFNAGIPAIAPAERQRVLGGEGCLWGECIRSSEQMFTLMFPRADALGESLWVARERLDWPGFLQRVAVQIQRYEAMKIPYFWEPESLAINIGGWKAGDVAAANGMIEIPLDGKLRHPGVQEFFVAQGTGEGQFVIELVELLKDGQVVDQDRHRYESSVYGGTTPLFLVKNPDVAGKYSVRIHVKPLFGECSATVQLIPALAPDQYSNQCAPDTGANRSKQLPNP